MKIGFFKDRVNHRADGGAHEQQDCVLDQDQGAHLAARVARRPEQGQFTINRVTIIPATINLNISRNYQQTIGIKATTGAGTELHNLKLVFEAADQSAGNFLPVGVHLTPDVPLSHVGSNQTATLNFTIWGDNTALETDS